MFKSGSLKIALYYTIASLVWIFLSDRALFLFKAGLNEQMFEFINSGKGFFFVIATGISLYFLIRNNNSKIQYSADQYRELYESNPNPMWIYDLDTLQFISVNNAAVSHYGYTREEFLTMTMKDIKPADEHDRLMDAVKHEGRYKKSGIWRHILKDGTIIHVDVSSHVITFNGKNAGMILANDCSEIIAHEKQLTRVNTELSEEKKRLCDIQELSKIAGWDYYIGERKLVLSDEIYEIFNIKRGDIDVDYQYFLKAVHHDDMPEFLAAAKHSLEYHTDFDIVHRFFFGRDNIKHIRELGKLEVRNGKPYKFRGTMQDITELKLIEHEKNLVSSENKKLDNIITLINNMVIMVDADSRITWVNKAYEDFSGYKLAEIIGRMPSTFMNGPDSTDTIAMINESQAQLKVFSVDIVNYTKTGEPYWVNIEFTPMFTDGLFTGYITVHNNITARKEKEEEITMQNSVLRDIAWLSSHEIRRPAASILGLMELIKNSDDVAEKDEYLRMLDSCAIELDQIIHQISNTINDKLPDVE